MLHSTLEEAYTSTGLISWKLLENPEVMESISQPIFQVFLNICDEWELSVPHRLKILGGIISESTYHNWKSGKSIKLNLALLERISLILGIYKALNLIFLNDIKAHQWLNAQNDEALFSSISPLNFILQGPVENLNRTRKYLDAWRGIK